MRRYVTFCCAVSADAAGRSAPVAGSGTSASRGTSTSPPAAPDGGSVRTRLGIQPPPYGAGSSAGSPSAAQTKRPTSSPKPAIGFHAAAGLDATPRLSHPFQGKSFSLNRQAERLPPVPGEVFQLDGSEKDCRVDAGLSVPAGVFLPLRVVAVARV